MRISEMRRRESYEDILAETLTRGWSRQYGRSVKVSFDQPDGQHWRLQPVLSAYCVAEPDVAVRRYLRDAFRFTPFAWRVLPQWILGTAVTTSLGMRLAGRSGLFVTPPIEGARSMALVPGNRRVRVFDFGRGRVRTFLKSGFDVSAMRSEVEVRGEGSSGPYPPIVGHGDDFSWLEEPILKGYDLSRCPPWLSKRRLLRLAFDELSRWSARQSRSADAATYLGELSDAVAEGIDAVGRRYDFARCELLADAARTLGELAADADEVALAMTHGDFQAGNIRVDRGGERVWVIDWEHAEVRSRYYDWFVFGLATRAGHGLAERLVRFLAGDSRSWVLDTMPASRDWRRVHLATFLLEDLQWYLHESLTGPSLRVSRGLENYAREFERLGPTLDPLCE